METTQRPCHLHSSIQHQQYQTRLVQFPPFQQYHHQKQHHPQFSLRGSLQDQEDLIQLNENDLSLRLSDSGSFIRGGASLHSLGNIYGPSPNNDSAALDLIARMKDPDQIRNHWYTNIKENWLSVQEYNHVHPFLQLDFSPRHFIRWFKYDQDQHKLTGDKSCVHAMLASVMLDTLAACRKGSYIIEFSSNGGPMQKTLDKNQFWLHAKESTYYGKDFRFKFDAQAKCPYKITMVEV